jgi:uncharacterized membrane protein required for colicin V production
MGIVIDVIVGILLVLASARGYARGFMFQIGQLAWALAAFFLSRWLGGLLESTAIDIGISESVAGTVTFALVFLVLYVAGSFLISRTTKEIHDVSKLITKSDRYLGLFLGAVKGALLVYVSFVVLIMAHRLSGSVPIPYGDSHTGRLVAQHNFLDSEDFPRARALKAIAKLGYIAGTQDVADLVRNPHFRAILNHPKAQVLTKPEIHRALIDQDWLTLVKDEEVWDLLDEPDIQEHLNAIEYGDQDNEDESPKRDFEKIPKIYLDPMPDD